MGREKKGWNNVTSHEAALGRFYTVVWQHKQGEAIHFTPATKGKA